MIVWSVRLSLLLIGWKPAVEKETKVSIRHLALILIHLLSMAQYVGQENVTERITPIKRLRRKAIVGVEHQHVTLKGRTGAVGHDSAYRECSILII